MAEFNVTIIFFTEIEALNWDGTDVFEWALREEKLTIEKKNHKFLHENIEEIC